MLARAAAVAFALWLTCVACGRSEAPTSAPSGAADVTALDRFDSMRVASDPFVLALPKAHPLASSARAVKPEQIASLPVLGVLQALPSAPSNDTHFWTVIGWIGKC